jgi:haloalkane dehalogenase
MHYVDEGPRGGELILCLHGQPTWSYLYRMMIPLFVAKGYRVIAPDFIGFGKSDKPSLRSDYTYVRHVDWLDALLTNLDLNDITLVCQDWGGLIGLRVAAQAPARFARIVTANTGLPDAPGIEGEEVQKVSDAMRAYYESLPVHQNAMEMGAGMSSDTSGMGFLHWVKFCAETPNLKVSDVVKFSAGGLLSDAQVAAYDAPFPDDSHMAGARQFPSLVPIMPDNPAITANRAAWQVLEAWKKPFFTAFSDSDPVTAGAHVRFQKSVPGAQGQKHVTIEGAGHFLQEQAPDALAAAVLQFVADNPF